MTIEVVKIARTDADVDNSRYELKEAYEVEDDYGTKVTLYRKRDVSNIEELEAQKAVHEEAIVEIDATIDAIKKAK